ncbi:MAG: hypothetical protein K6F88_05000 [Ruminococcus sp.]|nr:hypothetical protein [Ruminococcus sp.]
MKRLVIILVTIFIIGSVSMSGITANAAVIKRYSAKADNNSDGETNGEKKQTPQTNGSEDEILPSKYSSAELGYTTSVKTQVGNICWAYSSVSTFETTLLKNSLFYGDLNVNAIDSWGVTREDGTGWQRNTSAGGYTSIATGYFTSWNGPVTNDDSTTRYGTTQLRYYTKNDKDEVKKAIIRTGSVNANYNDIYSGKSADLTSFYVNSSITRISGHSISIVGWDDNYSKDYFTGSFKPENDGAWLCKNSWGNNNSIGGYLWISYEDYYLLNEEYFDYGFSIESFQEIKPNDYLYQNEEYGATYEFKYLGDKKQTFLNVFDFSENGNVLDKVVFESESAGAEYTVYYVPLDNNEKPVQNRSEWIKLNSGTINYSGYICADFDDFKVPQRKAAIAVEIDAKNISLPCGIGVSEWLKSEGDYNFIFINSSNRGESFIEYNGEITDVMDYYKNEKSDDIGGTLVIKAITNETVVTNIRGDVNIDGVIDINDVTTIQLYLAKLTEFTFKDQLVNADFNYDGIININDATAIQIRLATGD